MWSISDRLAEDELMGHVAWPGSSSDPAGACAPPSSLLLLLDHPVGAGEERWWHGDVEGPSCLEVNPPALTASHPADPSACPPPTPMRAASAAPITLAARNPRLRTSATPLRSASARLTFAFACNCTPTTFQTPETEILHQGAIQPELTAFQQKGIAPG